MPRYRITYAPDPARDGARRTTVIECWAPGEAITRAATADEAGLGPIRVTEEETGATVWVGWCPVCARRRIVPAHDVGPCDAEPVEWAPSAWTCPGCATVATAEVVRR